MRPGDFFPLPPNAARGLMATVIRNGAEVLTGRLPRVGGRLREVWSWHWQLCRRVGASDGDWRRGPGS